MPNLYNICHHKCKVIVSLAVWTSYLGFGMSLNMFCLCVMLYNYTPCNRPIPLTGSPTRCALHLDICITVGHGWHYQDRLYGATNLFLRFIRATSLGIKLAGLYNNDPLPSSGEVKTWKHIKKHFILENMWTRLCTKLHLAAVIKMNFVSTKAQ